MLNPSPPCTIQNMSEPKPIPPVLMSLGSNFDRARDFLDRTSDLGGLLGVQVEHTRQTLELVRMASDKNMFIFVNTHYTNEPAIQADLLHDYVFYGDEPLELQPDAISIEPQYRALREESNQLRRAVEKVESAGVRVIGVPDSYSLPVTHTEEFVRRAANSCGHIGSLGITAVEVIFPILSDLIEGENVRMNDGEHLIVSKTSRRKPSVGYKNGLTEKPPAKVELEVVKEGVVKAFELGAKTVTIGRTITGISDYGRQQDAIAEIIDLVPETRQL